MSARTPYPRVFWVANTIEVLERFAYYGIYFGFGIYMASLGYSRSQLGVVQSLFLLLSYVTPVVSGTFADRYGFKKVLIVAYLAWRVLSSFLARRRIPALLQDGAQMVDVRSPAEFAGGHAPGSVNIPLPELDQRMQELDRGRWVIVCCASGTRSALARRKLRGRGFDRVLNAGSWRNLP